MSDYVIKVENLSKSYVIRHHQAERYTALRDVLATGAKSMTKRLLGRDDTTRNSQLATREEFWALNDVSFEVKQGERIGIIGRNGAGKSTLLKILSRITEPTKGRVHIKGRVASLLEVGTGFHPELTGRENIYLNGAILGMSRDEIRRKFDEIVSFAEVETFLDTPVKRYSSGMYVRLAFAVAAHLEPEILLVDEVLAVGDAEFQKRCLGKMNDVANSGRTVLFVSHNMSAIKALCPHCVLLVKGQVPKFSPTDLIIRDYLNPNLEMASLKSRIVYSSLSADARMIKSIEWIGSFPWILNFREKLKIKIQVQVKYALRANLEVRIRDNNQVSVVFFAPGHFEKHLFELQPAQIYEFILETESVCLANGRYDVDLSLCNPNIESYESWENCFSFEVQNCDPKGTGFNYANTSDRGMIFIDHSVHLISSDITELLQET
jgi:lipopolysaccharide transport system ATP-binding protein